MTDAAGVERFCDPKLLHLHDPALLPGGAGGGRPARRRGAQRPAHRDLRRLRRRRHHRDGDPVPHAARRSRPDVPASRPTCPTVSRRATASTPRRCGSCTRGRRPTSWSPWTAGSRRSSRPALARELGLDLIITDHHHAAAGVPTACPTRILVHPRACRAARYPFGESVRRRRRVQARLALRDDAGAPLDARQRRAPEDAARRPPARRAGDDRRRRPARRREPHPHQLRLCVSSSRRRSSGLRALIEASDLMDEHIDCEKVGFVLGPAAERVRPDGARGGGRAHAHRRRARRGGGGKSPSGSRQLNRQRQQTERDDRRRRPSSRLAQDAGHDRRRPARDRARGSRLAPRRRGHRLLASGGEASGAPRS